MKYMLIHCVDESVEGAPGGDEGRPAIEDWIAEMEGRGVLLHGDRLRYVSTATTVRVRSSELLVSDGPFAESKEQIGGFWVIKAADLDAALEIAGRGSAACAGPVEVRPFQDMPES